MTLTIGPGMRLNPGVAVTTPIYVPPAVPPHGFGVFDGSSWLEVNGGSQFNLGTTWTIEFSVNASASSTTANGGIWGLLNQGGWATGNVINIALSGGYLIVGGGNDGTSLDWAEPIPNRWTNVAIVNNAGIINVFYNGIFQPLQHHGPGTYGSGDYYSTLPLYIGRLTPGYGGYYIGKLTKIRISDQAVYTSGNYTANLDPALIASHTRLLWKPTSESLLTDTSGSASSITNNGNNVTYDNSDIALTPLTKYAYVFNGTNSYVTAAGTTTDWFMQTGWTIEFWSKASVASPINAVFGVVGQSPGEQRIDVYYQNGKIWLSNGRGYPSGLCAEPTPGIWTQVTIVKQGIDLRVYYNGLQVFSGPSDITVTDNSNNLYLGVRGSIGIQFFPGSLAGVRINYLYSGTNVFNLSGATLTDSSPSTHAISNVNVTVAADGTY